MGAHGCLVLQRLAPLGTWAVWAVLMEHDLAGHVEDRDQKSRHDLLACAESESLEVGLRCHGTITPGEYDLWRDAARFDQFRVLRQKPRPRPFSCGLGLRLHYSSPSMNVGVSWACCTLSVPFRFALNCSTSCRAKSRIPLLVRRARRRPVLA